MGSKWHWRKVQFAADNVSLFALTLFVITAALIFGGAPNGYNWQNLIVMVPAIALIGLAVSNGVLNRFWRLSVLFRLFAFAVVLLPILQLVPLPPEVWASLPGRMLENNIIELAGGADKWRPITLNQNGTLLVWLSLIPPTGVFMATLLLNSREREALLLFVLAFAAFSGTIGIFQFASGGGILNFYHSSHDKFLLGFFANRNHQGLFLAVAASIGFWWAGARKLRKNRAIFAYAAASALFMVLAISTTSRAGMAFMFIAILTGWAARFGLGRRPWLSAAISVITLSVVIAGSSILNDNISARIERFESIDTDGRWQIWQQSLPIGLQYLPVGSGLGTYVPAFARFETLDEVGPLYINHAHNEYLELFVEAGVPGLLIPVFFILSYVLALLALLKNLRPNNCNLLCLYVVPLYFVLHSTVDYPLRTQALAVIFAIFLAIIWNRRDRVPETGS